jgi:hypothetical protein
MKTVRSLDFGHPRGKTIRFRQCVQRFYEKAPDLVKKYPKMGLNKIFYRKLLIEIWKFGDKK